MNAHTDASDDPRSDPHNDPRGAQDSPQDSPQGSPLEQPFAVTPRPREEQPSGLPMAGGTELSAETLRVMRQRRVANPDDPLVEQPLHGARGPLAGPDEPNLPGRMAIVQGQVYIVGVILIAQLLLITTALYELLSGRPDTVWWIAGASLAGFIIALIVAIWPRQRVLGR